MRFSNRAYWDRIAARRKCALIILRQGKWQTLWHVQPNGSVQPFPGQDAFSPCAGYALEPERHFQSSEPLRQRAFRVVSYDVWRILDVENITKQYHCEKQTENIKTHSYHKTQSTKKVQSNCLFLFSRQLHKRKNYLLTSWLYMKRSNSF